MVPTFNTLEAYDRLVKAGIPKEQACAHIELLSEIIKEPKQSTIKEKCADTFSTFFPFIVFIGFLLVILIGSAPNK